MARSRRCSGNRAAGGPWARLSARCPVRYATSCRGSASSVPLAAAAIGTASGPTSSASSSRARGCASIATARSTSSARVGGGRVLALLRIRARSTQALEEGEHGLARPLRLVAQSAELTQPPVPEQHRAEHLVVMDAQVVDAGGGDGDRPLAEAAQLEARHREAEDLPLHGQDHGGRV